MTNRYLYITLLAVLGFSSETQADEATNHAPRLVVSIAIDQLRSDYLDAFAPLYGSNGFKKLLAEGTVFANASYAFSPIDQASAIASVMTGTSPYYNGIVGRQWLNRATLRPIGCVDDEKQAGLLCKEGTSAVALSTSTLGDELKLATAGKALVYAIAPYREAAVLSAGHAADGALWLDDATGNWCSSTYYGKQLPQWVKAYNNLNPPGQKAKDVTWEPSNLLVGNFSYFMQTGQQKPFKHKFSGLYYFNQYKTSGLVNTDVTNMAQQCVKSSGMGNDYVTDLLALTYYAGSYDHQPVTDCQMELQDTYVRLDYELGRLVDFLETYYGRDNLLFVVTSTGYVDEESADYERFRIPTGTFYMNRTAGLINMYLGAIWGQGQYVETTFRNQMFLNHQLLESKKVSIAEASSRAQELLAMMSGVRNVYTSLQLLTGQTQEIQKTRNGFNPERCGDLVIEAAPGWRVLNEDSQQTELSRASLIQFPIIFYGADIEAQHLKTPVTADRIAPTVARAIRIRAPNACSVEPLF